VVLVGVRPGSATTQGRSEAERRAPRIPWPARPGDGVTVKVLAERVGKHPRTVRKHLNLLAGHGMAAQQDGRWYRLRFDPHALVDELGIEDTTARKAQEYTRQRRGYYEYLCRSHDGRPPVAVRSTDNGRLIYSDQVTGEELWSCPFEVLGEDTA
jgi:DNA-binding transcriptional ArsR family regulator